MTPDVDVELRVKANALLGLLGESRWQPGSFEAALLRAMLAADQHNLARLALVFPPEGRVVATWRFVPGGAATVRGWAGVQVGPDGRTTDG